MLADELGPYKGRKNVYVDNNIREIQDLYKEEEVKREEERIEDKEVILIKPYEVSETALTLSSAQTSFIMNEVKNFIKYIKFIQSLIQTRLFRPPLYYQSLKSKGEQDSEFWKEIAMALVNQKHNTETVRNSYSIVMFQGSPLHKPYFIAIDNWE